jgi:DNA-binding transcriptional ArsR family regulator
MAKYLRFETSNEVSDVLFAIINCNTNVKSVMKALKQPQSTVSSKLQFLRDNDVIIKDKWKFEPNWKTIIRIFQGEVKKYFENLLEFLKDVSKFNKKEIATIKDVIKRIPEIFDEKRVVNIYEMYADYFIDGCVKRISTSELAELYLDMLKRIDTIRFKGFDEDIVSIKKLFNKLNIRDMEEDFFIQAERNINSNL